MIPGPQPTSSPIVVLSTPIAVLGMMITILRERFRADVANVPALEWTWQEDLNDTAIFIESGWNTEVEARNVRPGIWVNLGQNIYQKVSIGNQDQMPVMRKMNLESFYGSGEVDVIVDCTAANRGTSMLVGSIVQDFLEMSSDLIQANFGLRDMSGVIMNPTAPFEKDDQLWNTQIQVRVYYENRWLTAPVGLLLNKIGLTLADVTNPNEYFRRVALRTKP